MKTDLETHKEFTKDLYDFYESYQKCMDGPLYNKQETIEMKRGRCLYQIYNIPGRQFIIDKERLTTTGGSFCLYNPWSTGCAWTKIKE